MLAALSLAGAGTLASGVPAAAQAQTRRPAQAAPAPAPAPALPQGQTAQPSVDAFTASRLVWSSLLALDQANRTGNYSVLRDLGAPSFQANNTSATLAGIFQAVRAQQVDLSYSLIQSPVWEFAPTVLPNGLLRTRGGFPLRPTAIVFDMLFENVRGEWRLFGISVAPVAMTAAAPPRR